MTDEERRRLCSQLREYSFQEAADEIERLEKEVARLKDENGVIQEQYQNMLDMMEE